MLADHVCVVVQMATFMRDLEFSGLLADDEAAAASGAEAAAPAPDAANYAAVTPNGTLGPSSADTSVTETCVKSQHAAHGDADTEFRSGATARDGARHAEPMAERRDEVSAGGGDGAGTATSEIAGEDGGGGQAEQRVLGALQGIEGWSEVMDMASRQVRLCWGPACCPIASPGPRNTAGVPQQAGSSTFA